MLVAAFLLGQKTLEAKPVARKAALHERRNESRSSGQRLHLDPRFKTGPHQQESRVGDSRQLLLAPLSVLPQYQNCGIGSALIKEGHRKAKELGYEYCFLVGHAGYYPRFGYVRASALGVTCSLELPDENFMGIDLRGGRRPLNAELILAPVFLD